MRPPITTHPHFANVEGQSINILMGLNCRFYPRLRGSGSLNEPPIPSLSFSRSTFVSGPFAHPVSALSANFLHPKTTWKPIFTGLSALACTLKSCSIHSIVFSVRTGKREFTFCKFYQLPGKIQPTNATYLMIKSPPYANIFPIHAVELL